MTLILFDTQSLFRPRDWIMKIKNVCHANPMNSLKLIFSIDLLLITKALWEHVAKSHTYIKAHKNTRIVTYIY